MIDALLMLLLLLAVRILYHWIAAYYLVKTDGLLDWLLLLDLSICSIYQRKGLVYLPCLRLWATALIRCK
jgi:hypothetical protein